MTVVIPTEVYENGNLVRIEYYNEDDVFEIQAQWDENDEQTSENREKFRKWATGMVEKMGFEVKL